RGTITATSRKSTGGWPANGTGRWPPSSPILTRGGCLRRGWRRRAGEGGGPPPAFLADLKQRGMFEATLVMWGGEFGRTPVAELPELSGRDHNHYGFSMWLAGGGGERGQVLGAPAR